MRVIKPYGRSHVENSDAGAKRKLAPRDRPTDLQDIQDYASNHPELVIAQWISAIDKIATKPKSGKPTEGQRRLRDKLGGACWRHIKKEGLLNGKTGLKALWNSKIHPYKEGTCEGRNGKTPNPKGRWYERFTDGGAPEDVDFGKVAKKIHEHLYDAAYRKNPQSKKKSTGHIAQRAQSIAGNVLKPHEGFSIWCPKDEEDYKSAGDVAGKILCEAKKRENSNHRVTPDVAGKELYDHYGRLFNGRPIATVKKDQPGLFALHMAVKDCYVRLLKDSKKKKPSKTLPKNMDGLYALIKKQQQNRDVNALIRLGKVIHYEAGDRLGSADGYKFETIKKSRFWGSDGQAQIKRNEAFVRVWRHVLTLAQRTVTDWADTEGQSGQDILGSRQIAKAVGDAFASNRFDAKFRLLFGSRVDDPLRSGTNDDSHKKALLKAALSGLSALRNHSFHFKGLHSFTTAMQELGEVDKTALDAMRCLWQQDSNARTDRMRDTLQGADVEYFLCQSQAEKLLTALTQSEPSALPLPRFNRIISRAENTRLSGLPKSVNRQIMETSPALRCQYICLKLLYERPFRQWVERLDVDRLNGFIDEAVKRTRKAAAKINAGDRSEEEKAVITAKAAELGTLSTGDSLQDFFFRLTAHTATEMRVQRGYESDGEQAKKQAKYIEDLKCDLLARAFKEWLKDEGYGFLTRLSKKTEKPADRRCDLERIETPQKKVTNDTADEAAPWQHHLYYLLHLVPVDDVAKLLHQMRKWEILTGETEQEASRQAKAILAVLLLYLDMHDAKFTGGDALTGVTDFERLYKQPEDFHKVFRPVTDGADDDRHIPIRGLREIMRFGHLGPLRRIYENHPVSSEEVAAYLDADIAQKQREREDLHRKLVRNKKKYRKEEDLRQYKFLVDEVSEHRHRAARVTLTDHVRLHRLMMAVLGRLVDYAGLFERDLYFVTLALMHEEGVCAKDTFKDGQIVKVLQAMDEKSKICGRLAEYFGPVCKKVKHGNERAQIRNDFLHFNMLRKDAIDLTACVNKARTLMAYDRKLKNAVSQSIVELLAREGLRLCWHMGGDHQLQTAKLRTEKAKHLGGNDITEPLHGDSYVRMVAALFGGSHVPPKIGGGTDHGKPQG